MTHFIRWPQAARWPLALALLLPAGCARHPNVVLDDTVVRPSGRRDLITQAEMAEHAYMSVYDVVLALHANWLATRGPDTILGGPPDVVVRLDEMRYGGIQSLRSLPVMNIAYIQYFDPLSASARWGLDHNHGAILVATHLP